MSLDLNARVTGSGWPLIILHGLFGSAQNWAGISGKLSERWNVHALDLRNHGDSPWAPGMDYADMAADVLHYMDQTGLDRSAVVGHSMGGKTAMAAALTAPERIAMLTVVDIAPIRYENEFVDYVRAMRAVDVSRVERRSDVDAQLANVVADAGVRAFLLQNLTREETGYRWRINLDALADQMEALGGFPDVLPYASYDGPTLFLSGGASDYVRPRHEGRIRELFPMAEMAEITGAGHWVHAEAPAAFLERLTAFLTDKESQL